MRQVNEVHLGIYVCEVHGVFVYVAFQELSRKWVWVLTTAGTRKRPLKCVLLYGFCSSIHCSRGGNTGCTIVPFQGKLGLWSPCTSSVRYAILFTIITKGNNQLCLWAGGKELSWGVEKQVYTLLIWTLLLVLSLLSLSRTSKPGNGMNSILHTCKFINCCVYSRI